MVQEKSGEPPAKQKRPKICKVCKGTGIDPETHFRYTTKGHDDRRCPKCNGEGKYYDAG